jgi:hypothetical protein
MDGANKAPLHFLLDANDFVSPTKNKSKAKAFLRLIAWTLLSTLI